MFLSFTNFTFVINHAHVMPITISVFFVSVNGDLKICQFMAHIELTIHYLNKSSSYIELNLAGLPKLRLVSLLMILVNSNP
jgi:hypothetical protein